MDVDDPPLPAGGRPRTPPPTFGAILSDGVGPSATPTAAVSSPAPGEMSEPPGAPSYHSASVIGPSPSYRRQLRPHEQTLAQGAIRHRPGGRYVKASKFLTVSLGGQEPDCTMPSYGRTALIDGVISIAPEALENVLKVEVKIEGDLKLMIAEGGHITHPLLSHSIPLFFSASPAPCPVQHAFSFRLPPRFEDEGTQRPLPPTYEVNFSGVPGIRAVVRYWMTIKLVRKKLWKRKEVLVIPFVYFPRARPPQPIVGMSFLSSLKSHPEEWSLFSSNVLPRFPDAADSMITSSFVLPSTNTFPMSRKIPFHLQLSLSPVRSVAAGSSTASTSVPALTSSASASSRRVPLLPHVLSSGPQTTIPQRSPPPPNNNVHSTLNQHRQLLSPPSNSSKPPSSTSTPSAGPSTTGDLRGRPSDTPSRSRLTYFLRPKSKEPTPLDPSPSKPTSQTPHPTSPTTSYPPNSSNASASASSKSKQKQPLRKSKRNSDHIDGDSRLATTLMSPLLAKGATIRVTLQRQISVDVRNQKVLKTIVCGEGFIRRVDPGALAPQDEEDENENELGEGTSEFGGQPRSGDATEVVPELNGHGHQHHAAMRFGEGEGETGGFGVIREEDTDEEEEDNHNGIAPSHPSLTTRQHPPTASTTPPTLNGTAELDPPRGRRPERSHRRRSDVQEVKVQDDWAGWEGEVVPSLKQISVGGFRAAGLSVRDFIILTLIPPDPETSPLRAHQHAVPVRIVTDAWDEEWS